MLRTAFELTVLAGFAFGLTAFVNGWIVVFSIKPGRIGRYFNPANAIFYPDDLTERGLRARRRVGWSTLGFLICYSLGLAFGLSGGASN